MCVCVCVCACVCACLCAYVFLSLYVYTCACDICGGGYACVRVYNVWRVCLYVCVQTGVLRGPDLQQGLYMRSLGELHDASFILYHTSSAE